MNTLPQFTIYEATTIPAITTSAILRAVCARETTAISGARALATATGRVHFVRVEDADADRSIRILWAFPQDAIASVPVEQAKAA